MSGGGDEDDAADEALFMQESLELHYNVAELIGTALYGAGLFCSAKIVLYLCSEADPTCFLCL